MSIFLQKGDVQMAEILPEAFLLLDENGYIQYVNKRALELFEYSPHDLKDKPFYWLYGKDSFKCSYELEQAKANGRFTSEGWKYKKDGPRIWAEMTLSALYENNEFIGYSCLILDRTDRKEQELRILESEERYRLMVEGVKDYAIFLLDRDGYITTWNEGAKRIKGYAAGEIIGKHFSTFYISEDLASKKPERELKIAVATGQYEEEGWRIKKNGSLFWANVVITALFNNKNELIGFSKVTRDLSERKEVQEALMQSEERYRLLIEQLTDYGIFMLDEKGRVISWNEGARRISGYNADEIIGKYFSTFYPEEDILDNKPARELQIAQAEGKYAEEGWRLKKDGSRFWANVVITPVYNSEGVLLGFSKVTRDLTEKKKVEQEVKESYDRYRLLAAEYQASNKTLVALNEELEQFTSIVSHDLQEPVRTMKSFLQLIELKLENADYDNLKTYTGKALNAANRMRELIHNLLQYSQLSKKEIVKERIMVDELLSEVLQNLRTAIERSRARVMVESELLSIEGDRIQLIQLLQNLVSNALKFVDSRDPEVIIRCYVVNGVPTFSVSDNGIGIEQNDIGKIFEIFKRLNTKKEYPGTGIGLSICKKIVDRHQGTIWLESEKGRGSTFYFTLGTKVESKQDQYEEV